MQLVLEQYTVRPWRLDDAESMARHANNRKIWLAVRDLFPHPYTIQDAHEFLQRTMSEEPEMKFCIEIEGAAVGGIGVHPGQDVHRYTVTVRYWLGEDFWGRDVMTQALTAGMIFVSRIFPSAESLRRCFRTTLLPRVCWRKPVSLSKDASRTTFSKMGNSRFTSLRPHQIAPGETATCVSLDHRRYGSP